MSAPWDGPPGAMRGIKVPDGERMISLIIPESDKTLLAVCENGYGKRTPSMNFPGSNAAVRG